MLFQVQAQGLRVKFPRPRITRHAVARRRPDDRLMGLENRMRPERGSSSSSAARLKLSRAAMCVVTQQQDAFEDLQFGPSGIEARCLTLPAYTLQSRHSSVRREASREGQARPRCCCGRIR